MEKKHPKNPTKKNYGQFYTTNYNYIFQNMDIHLFGSYAFIEPFVGKGHLVDFIESRLDTSHPIFHRML
jgi:hypothetical protein